MPTINWLLIALHSHGQIYRGRLIVLSQVNLFYYLVLDTTTGQASLPILGAFGLWLEAMFLVNSRRPLFSETNFKPKGPTYPSALITGSPSCKLTGTFRSLAPLLANLQGYFAEFLKINYTITFSPLVLVLVQLVGDHVTPSGVVGRIISFGALDAFYSSHRYSGVYPFDLRVIQPVALRDCVTQFGQSFYWKPRAVSSDFHTVFYSYSHYHF